MRSLKPVAKVEEDCSVLRVAMNRLGEGRLLRTLRRSWVNYDYSEYSDERK